MAVNIYMMDVTHDYYIDIAKQLVGYGSRIRAIGASKYPEYWPRALDDLIASQQARVILWEDFSFPERFERVFDPDYSVLTAEMREKLAHYEKMFVLSTDRLAFFPIPQIERCRLFYRFVCHFYKIFKEERIDALVLFGIPHGLASIAAFGLAKAMGLKALYVDWGGLDTNLAIVETDFKPRRSYTGLQTRLGLVANESGVSEVHELVQRSIHKDTNMNPPKPRNRWRVFLRTIGSLLLKRPFGRYDMPEFFLDPGRRIRISYVPSLVRFFYEASKAIRFYDRRALTILPDEKALVVFLHFQPEAVTMPQGGIFADQLLVMDLLLAALPEGMTVWVKEHPFMFDMFAQDKHERSVKFYEYLLKDSRVRFIDRSVTSRTLLEKGVIFASTNGTVSWEAMRIGKPCIIFGWSWFSQCKSCFVVDSVDSLKAAFAAAARKTPVEILADLDEFLAEFENRLIHAVPWRYALDYVEKDFSYDASVARLARAIGATLELPGMSAAITSENHTAVAQSA